MPDDIVIKILLLPVALLYGLGVATRNFLYRTGILRSVRFDLPVISIGNLSVGGAGKSPHIEYLLKWLDQYIEPAVLSRGYGRKTAGFRMVTAEDDATLVGDEPLQFKQKFPNLPICVSESRALGVPELIKRHPQIQCVLLDDAFQHLAVTPGLNVLLTEYQRPFTRDWLLPSGRLREWRHEYQRADIIIVTKCPPQLTTEQRHKMYAELDPYPRQRVYFSEYRYGMPYDLLRPDLIRPFEVTDTILLVSAIANTDYLLEYLAGQVQTVHTREFEDHHYFTETDVLELLRRFDTIPQKEKIMVTTEKDATRLALHRDFFWKNEISVYVLPVEVAFLQEDETGFQQDVQQFLLDFKS
jgi:tetraacyldisaccharide 4'-kinase